MKGSYTCIEWFDQQPAVVRHDWSVEKYLTREEASALAKRQAHPSNLKTQGELQAVPLPPETNESNAP